MTWREIQKTNFTSLQSLASFLELAPQLKEKLFSSPAFPLNLPQRLAKKIEKNTLDDPLLRQFVPLREESLSVPGFFPDPVQDQTFRSTKKLLQKYKGRALLLTTSGCAMHCRFCFRQNFPYETETPGFSEELRAIAQDSSLQEIILSGGDPLSLSDRAIAHLLNCLDAIPHIQRIRFHTRFPIGIPERIDSSFLKILASIKKALFFVLHCNHSRELDFDVLTAMKKIQNLGIPVLSQSVLLKEVNDTPEALLDLYEALLRAQIVPYYLHLLDPVQGASHYEVSETQAYRLIRFLQENLPGFGVPRLAREEPGKTSKTFSLNPL